MRLRKHFDSIRRDNSMTINFLLIDALNVIRRVYAAQPGEDGPERVEYAQTSTVQSLQRAVRECMPTHACCVFDSQEPGWRHDMYPGYKAGRTPMPDALQEKLSSFKNAFSDLGVSSIEIPTLEADDVIATLACKVASRNGHVIILSTDKSFFQLISEQITIRDHFNKRDIDYSSVMDKFAVRPDQFADFLALSGDSTNNIVGVPSVGKKTAARLLTQFDTLDDVLSAAHIIPGKLGEMIRSHSEDARAAQTLVRLRIDLELGLNLRTFRYGH
jgi:protein Xni